MPKVDVYNLDRKKVGKKLELDDSIFDAEVREHLFHEIVRAQLASKRAGTAKTKERGEIRGTTHKIWKQKGTGRARQGTKKAPHWIGGGVSHGPRVRTFGIKVNKKVKRAGLIAALSRRQQEGKLVVINDMALAEVKTKTLVGITETFETGRALFCDVDNKNMFLSSRNIPSAHFVPVGELNVYDILRCETLLLSKAAVDALHTRIGS